METSDSECFESADEDFFSDNEADRKEEKSCENIPQIEKLQNLNINEGQGKPNVIKESIDDRQARKEFVGDVTICSEEVNEAKEVTKNKQVKNLDLKSKLDTENKNILEDNTVCNSNDNKSTSIHNSNSNVITQKHEQKHMLDCDKNKNKVEHEDIKSIHTINVEESSPKDHSVKQLHQIKEEITCKETKITDTKVDTLMWENDGWDFDDNDIKDDKCETTDCSTSNTDSTNTFETEGIDTQNLNQPLVSQQVKSDNQKQTIDVEEENMWDNDDDWEPIEETNKQPESSKTENQSKSPTESKSTSDSWSSWGNWGVSSILTSATQGVSTLTSHVSQGLNTIVDTSLGIPDPQELARLHKREKEELEAKIRENSTELQHEVENSNTGTLGFGLGNLGNLVSGVSNLTKLVETTGSKVISGGLDTLETIGKKTMEVLQEGDPGLKKKRQFLKLEQEKPILSQVLREAKEKAEQENRSLQQKHIVKKKNYETLFDDHHGLVHLEALEMLSRQCDFKLKTLMENCDDDKSLMDLQETMDQVKELCELPDEDDEEQATMEDIKEKLQSAIKELNIKISYDKLLLTWEETETWLNTVNLKICDENELHQQAIETLAQLTAIAVEQFHKAGELLLIKEHHSTADEADSLVQ
ncbi:unnamed protein product [Acanthoscelides obtectus]|nr:unnamed protein product [Acanthoscelides obtectus]CAK1620646.1 Protein FAM114A2 [Acanthoscelides obtectus]